MNQAVEILLEFSILLPFSLWRKVSRNKENEAFANLNEAAFKLIANNKFIVADRILEYALNLDKIKVSQADRQMMTVNRASANRHIGNEAKSIEILDAIDWSASSDLFKICVASIKGNNESVIEILPLVRGSNSLSARDFKDWPCLAFARKDEGVRKKFEEVYGEPLELAPQEVVSSSPETDKADNEPAHTGTEESSEGTVH